MEAATQIHIPGPAGSGLFGSRVTPLPNGNIVVTDPGYDSPTATNVGAVYLYNGATAQLISVLTGDTEQDAISNFGITVLSNGNYLVISPNWQSNRGAVTFCDKAIGCTGVVSATNSLVGATGGGAGDRVGSFGATGLTSGGYVVSSPMWGGQNGAVTWGNGTTGISGVVSVTNSLVGIVPSDRVGTGVNGTNGVTRLSNGNYVVISSSWSNNRGATTFCIGTVGCTGTISASNSLVGNVPLDSVGNGGIQELTNGNYVVRSSSWDNGATTNVGAVTWASGLTGVIGAVSSSNSLIGGIQSESIGSVTPLTNGNYVVLGPRSATFGNGSSGITGVASAANSLVGNNFFLSSVVALTNGNYVVVCPRWDNGTIANAGAVTLGNGSVGTIGTISPSNSLVGDGINGSIGGDGVTPLTNGNYVVRSSFWSSSRGAVTFGNGVTGITGTVSAANSLAGTNPGDRIGVHGVTALANGNYVVSSADWDNGAVFNAGAITFANGSTGIVGMVSSGNSLVGTHTSDNVGFVGVVALPNGNYVACNSDWNDSRGAASFGNGTTGTVGDISASNSLIGTNVDDYVCWTVNVLSNGNYAVVSQQWNGVRGAVTLGNGSTGITGTVSPANSLTGTNVNDRVGGGNNLAGVYVLPDGNFVASSPNWSGDFGAVTWVNGTTGLTGPVSQANSVVGSTALDLISNGSVSGPKGVTTFSGGHYAAFSPVWNNGTIVDAGAVTLGRPGAPITGPVSVENSVRGTQPSSGSTLTFAHDPVNSQYVVGQPLANRVTFFRFPRSPFDFDGDGKTDIGIFRPSGGEWWINRSSNGQTFALQFGASTDVIAPADYTGDGKTDIAFFRPSSGEWYVLRSEDNSFFAVPFGTNGDVPAPADYDADGKADFAVFRPSSGTWFISQSGGGGTRIEQFGVNGDQPIVADYDGDGKADVGIFRMNGGVAEWWINRSTAGLLAMQFGASTDNAVQGDYTGDGKADIAIWRPSTGEWFIVRSENSTFYGFPFGTNGDIVAPGDYDGDGKFDVTVFRPSSATWFISRTTAGTQIVQFGSNGDQPIPNAFVP